MTDEEKFRFKLPYVMTMSLINEAINLSQEWRDGKVKLVEPRLGTKDIIISFAYGNYISSLIINDLEMSSVEALNGTGVATAIANFLKTEGIESVTLTNGTKGTFTQITNAEYTLNVTGITVPPAFAL